jgi:hypothetical protein
MTWDIFISHASEDKQDFVRPLAEELRARGYNVWYDEFTLQIGDSLRQRIDQGLLNSRFGIVVLSPSFFAKSWPQRELDGLTTREVLGGKVILPVWHQVSYAEVAAYSPVLADRVAVLSSLGTVEVVNSIERVLKGGDAETAVVPARRATSQALSGIPADVLIFTLERALSTQFEVPEADEVMEALSITADQYADAVEELDALGLIRTFGNGNHASGYARAMALPTTLLQVGPQGFPEIDFHTETESLIRAFGQGGRNYVTSKAIAEAIDIPLPRLQLLVDALDDLGLVERRGGGVAGELDFGYGCLTPQGRRVLNRADDMPVLGGKIQA